LTTFFHHGKLISEKSASGGKEEQPMSKFVLRKVSSGYKFDLTAANGQVILSSEVYAARSAALKGIASVRSNAPKAHVENQTEEGCKAMPHPKFEMYQDRSGRFRFRLKARNGKIVAVSEGYATKHGCLSGIECVKKCAPEAEIVK
jgi:uncharacterized protein YegP (UPF0339 family)